MRLVPAGRFVFADALEAERIVPLDAEDVVDHSIDQSALAAPSGAHQNDVLVFSLRIL